MNRDKECALNYPILVKVARNKMLLCHLRIRIRFSCDSELIDIQRVENSDLEVVHF